MINLDNYKEIIFVTYCVFTLLLTGLLLWFFDFLKLYITNKRKKKSSIILFEKRMKSDIRISEALKWESKLIEMETIIATRTEQ